MIPLERFLDQATQEFLLEDREEYTFELRFNEKIRNSPKAYEDAINKIGFLKIDSYRDVKEGHVWVGRPARISFTLKDLSRERPEILQIKADWNEALSMASEATQLSSFLAKNYSLCFKKPKTLIACIKIFEYLQKNRSAVRGFFPRQVPHAESSKLILKEPLLLRIFNHVYTSSSEGTWKSFLQYYGLRPKPYSFWFYTPECILSENHLYQFSGLLNEKNRERFKPLMNPTLILENEETFLALQETQPKFNLLRGNGKTIAAASFLRQLFQGSIYYWGDIDKDGYEILRKVHEIFPNLKPLLMDTTTLARYSHLVQNIPPAVPSAEQKMPFELQTLYEDVCRKGIRIEQEKIPLSEIFSSPFLK